MTSDVLQQKKPTGWGKVVLRRREKKKLEEIDVNEGGGGGSADNCIEGHYENSGVTQKKLKKKNDKSERGRDDVVGGGSMQRRDTGKKKVGDQRKNNPRSEGRSLGREKSWGKKSNGGTLDEARTLPTVPKVLQKTGRKTGRRKATESPAEPRRENREGAILEESHYKKRQLGLAREKRQVWVPASREKQRTPCKGVSHANRFVKKNREETRGEKSTPGIELLCIGGRQ